MEETFITPELRKKFETILRSMKWKVTDGDTPLSVKKSFTGNTDDYLWVSCCIVVIEQGRVRYKGALQCITEKTQIVLSFELAEIAIGVAERQIKEKANGKENK